MFDAPENPSGLRLQVAGVPVVITGSALLFPALIAFWFTELRWAVGAGAVVLGSVLLHELGHAAAFRAFGIRSRIVLHAMGGVTIGERSVAHRPGRIMVSLAGPLAELVLLGLPAVWALGQADLDPQSEQFLSVVVVVTVGWSLFNLLPILPLDGGHVTEEVIDALTRGRGFVASRVVSIVVASTVALLALATGWVVLALFVLAMAWVSVKDLRDRRGRAQITALGPAHEAYRAGRTAEALAEVLPRVGRRQRPEAKAAAVAIAAWSALAEDDLETARAVVSQHPAGQPLNGHLRALLVEHERSEQLNATVDAWLENWHLEPATYVRWIERMGLAQDLIERVGASRADGAVPASLILLTVLFHQDRFDAAARLGESLFGSGADRLGEHGWVIAFNTACSHSRAGRPADGLRWLEVAGDIGLPDPSDVDTDPDLVAVRALPGFPDVRRRIRTAPPSP